MAEGKRIFVTVGTTKFEKLVEKVCEDDVLDKLSKKGYKSITFQTGVGRYKEKKRADMQLGFCPYFENFEGQIRKADLIISHAGAGTSLDVLRLKKPLIVVINEGLMDNHQVELAEQLQSLGYLYYCTVHTLPETLDKAMDFDVFPECNKERFRDYVDKCMGFSE